MFKQDKLAYEFAALEPHIDQLTMEIHYGKHHAAYTNNFNAAMEKLPALQGKSVEEILSDLPAIADPALRTAVRNNGGGFYNHNLYFGILSPQGGGEPQGDLKLRINEDFEAFPQLKEDLTKAALGVFGSGWAWLSVDGEGKLSVSSTPNQDNPFVVAGGAITPILGIDVWEHAYYLKYKNARPDYLSAIFNVIDWEAVAARYAQALGK